jgi:hypothetical protein
VAVLRAGWHPLGRGSVRGRIRAVPAQFFATPELRVAHGVLTALGCILLATTIARATTGTVAATRREPAHV